MTPRSWETKYQTSAGYWRGIRIDGRLRDAFVASSEEMFDKFLDPTCNCSLAQTDMKLCPAHEKFEIEK